MQFEPTNAFYAGVMSGAERECRRRGLALHYTQMDDSTPDAPQQYAQSDAFLLVGTIAEAAVLGFKELGRPIVLVDNNLPHLGLDRVLTENVGSVYRAVAKMAEWGHRRVALLAGPDTDSSFQERRVGYNRAISALGLEPVVIECGGVPAPGAVSETMSEYLREHERPEFTALLCCNDEMAIEAMHTLQHAGVRVPEEVSVVGFDGVEVGRMVRPALTTMQVQRERMGQEGVRLLMERVEHPSSPAQAIVLDTTFVERESACPPRL